MRRSVSSVNLPPCASRNARDLALGLALARLHHGVDDAREQSALGRGPDGCFGNVRHERDVAGHKEGFEGHGDLLVKRTDPRRFLLVVLIPGGGDLFNAETAASWAAPMR